MADRGEQGDGWAGALESLLASEDRLSADERHSLEDACERALERIEGKPPTLARLMETLSDDPLLEDPLRKGILALRDYGGGGDLSDLVLSGDSEEVDAGGEQDTPSITTLNLGGAEEPARRAIVAAVLSSADEGTAGDTVYHLLDSEAAEKLAAVGTWQRCPYVHPLTCGLKSSHRVLVGRLREGEVWLVCRDCGYVQRPDEGLWEMILRLHRGIREYGGHPMDDELPQRWRIGDERG